MTTKKAEEFAKRMLERSDLKSAKKIVVLGLNRDNPGFGDDAVLMDRETGKSKLFDGIFERGTRFLKDKAYSMACDEYREDSLIPDDSDEDDICTAEDDLYEDCADWNAGSAEYESDVIVPKGAKSMTPGTEIRILYCPDGDDTEPKEAWISDSYRIDMIEIPYSLAFHTNASMDGIMLDEDFFKYPLICWNTGSRPIKVDGQKILAGEFLIFRPSDPNRRKRRLRHMDIMSLPLWDSKVKIEENEKRLLASGCPAEDVHILAGYFWRSSFYSVEDYNLTDHAAWMDEVHREGGREPQS